MSGGRRPAIETSAVATGKGDDGTTGLLYGGPRISKDDLRTEAYGTIDEAVAALGIARAALPDDADIGRAPDPHPSVPAGALRRGGRAGHHARGLAAAGGWANPRR